MDKRMKVRPPGGDNVGDILGGVDREVTLADVLPGFLDDMLDSCRFEEALQRAFLRRGGKEEFLVSFWKNPDRTTLDLLAKVLVEAGTKKYMAGRRKK